MKRRVIIMLVFLLAGVIVNVGVAIALSVYGKSPLLPSHTAALFPRGERYAGQLEWLDRMGWRELPPSDRIVYPAYVHEANNAGVTLQWMIQTEDFAPGASGRNLYIPLIIAMDVRTGWPFRSLWGGVHHENAFNGTHPNGSHLMFDSTGSPSMEKAVHVNSTSTDFGSHDVQCIPLAPLWPGFVANSVIYAAAVWMLIGLPIAAWRHRRRRRVQRNLCPACAYDLRGAKHVVCPECGKEVV